MTSIVKSLLAVTAAVGVFATAAMGLTAPALAAPTGASSADTTVGALKADGYDVILNRTGHAPLTLCAVTAVRPGHEVIRTDSGNPGDVLATSVISTTVYVDVEC